MGRAAHIVWFGILGCSASVHAAVSDIELVGVTPTAFSVVWFSDEAINSNSVRVFNDQAGLDEITAGLTITSDSAAVANAHAIGVSKVSVAGLQAGQAVFVQTVTDSASGVLEEPAAGALIPLTSQNAVTRTSATGQIITNDIVDITVNDPADEVTPLSGALTIVQVVDAAGAPVTGPVAGLVGESGGASVLLNLNNLFATATGETAETATDGIVRVADYRGLACADVQNQRRISFGRIPAHEELPPITELETLAQCFFADRVCDDVVNALDVQFVLNSFNALVGECAFNPYLDVVPNNAIDALDAQAILNRFGEQAPFVP